MTQTTDNQLLVSPTVLLMTVLKDRCPLLAGLVAPGNIHGAEVPKWATKANARPCIVVAVAGGAGLGIGDSDSLDVTASRMDVFAYGNTFAEAERVALTVRHSFKGLNRVVVSKMMMTSIIKVAGPVQFNDRDIDWPCVQYTYQMIHADRLLD